MANWITHLMIADRIIKAHPRIHRRGFCVGSIGPDCNIENADWTDFTPSRDVTHWMREGKKEIAGAERFWEQYAAPCIREDAGSEKAGFMIGYYAHLITDVTYLELLHQEARVARMWQRILDDAVLGERLRGLEISWKNFRSRFSKSEIMDEQHLMEAEYLANTPDSGFMTEILPLERFPDYLDYLLPGSITRKAKLMAVIPPYDAALSEPIVVSREEFYAFIDDTAALTVELLRKKPEMTQIM